MAAATLLQPITSHAVQLSTEVIASVHAWFASAYEWIKPCAHAYLRHFFYCCMGAKPLYHVAEEELLSTQTRQVICL